MTRGQTVQLKKAFLEHFRVSGNVLRSCQAAGVTRRAQVYEWQEHDDAFAVAFHQAEIEATEVLEDEARRRAAEGTRRLKFDKDGKALMDPETGDYYIEREYSDTLLIFLLKARAPEKYRDRYDVTTGGQPLQSAYDHLEADIRREADKVLAARARETAGHPLGRGDERSSDTEDAAR
jgi:hypothetical protein